MATLAHASSSVKMNNDDFSDELGSILGKVSSLGRRSTDPQGGLDRHQTTNEMGEKSKHRCNGVFL